LFVDACPDVKPPHPVEKSRGGKRKRENKNPGLNQRHNQEPSSFHCNCEKSVPILAFINNQ